MLIDLGVTSEQWTPAPVPAGEIVSVVLDLVGRPDGRCLLICDGQDGSAPALDGLVVGLAEMLTKWARDLGGRALAPVTGRLCGRDAGISYTLAFRFASGCLGSRVFAASITSLNDLPITPDAVVLAT